MGSSTLKNLSSQIHYKEKPAHKVCDDQMNQLAYSMPFDQSSNISYRHLWIEIEP